MKLRNSLLLALTISATSHQSASAASQYWNPSPLTGTWDAATVNWATTSGGTAANGWTNLNDAFFD